MGWALLAMQLGVHERLLPGSVKAFLVAPGLGTRQLMDQGILHGHPDLPSARPTAPWPRSVHCRSPSQPGTTCLSSAPRCPTQPSSER